MSRLFIIILLCSASLSPIIAESKYIFLFQSAKARAIAGLERQKARRLLADQSFRRASELAGTGTISTDEYEQFDAAGAVAALDLEIAELRAKQATISLDLAVALARNGQRIPLCRRRRPTDENTVSRLLKRPKPTELPKPIPLPENPGSGTKIEVQEVLPKPEEPEIEQPNVQPGSPVIPVTPDPGEEEPVIPVQPEPKPNPQPGGGNPNPSPKP